MAYLGNRPAEAYSAFQKQDFSTSATTSYTLDHPVANQNEIALFINFVRQEPTAAYTASGTTLTLTSATASSDDMYCIYLGKAVQTVNPPSGSVGSSQVASTIITGQTAETSVADDDLVLVSDTSASAALKKMTVSNLVANAGGGKINQVVYTSSNVNQNVSSDTELMSLAITPSASDSKIFISYTGAAQLGANEYGSFDIYRGSLASGTKVLDGGESTFNSADLTRFGFSLNYLDSPSTTSATTYTIVGVPNGTVQFGATAANTLTLMEVLA